ncbi:MAG TPA: adenylyl-sulfate kinase [Candidatus Omnitrophica bacterium]|nr:MAG: adenylyl-sulfate kinase [Omnitrophica WOR_2 bacterium GWA2_45_18]HBR14340.1 adenylyl-sulfate kinase [Candidatus Omnitrophota bacterium]
MSLLREQMNVVIVGHVDHGKSTLVGRLLADTGSLPEGKLEAVKANCLRNAKPFEYAFLLDALKDEQSQGITIDTARCFFKSKKRDYIIIDAPGHIEFLKNMISGAARAEAAVLVIDAKEGIRENSKRHGYMMSFLGIKNFMVCVNKMDMVDYSQEVFENIKSEYSAFLEEINIKPKSFIPIAAREGDNIISISPQMPWYQEAFLMEALDNFSKAAPNYARPLRFPIQDIYKFTAEGDERRIMAGRIESGTVSVGEEVVFFPSYKTSRIETIEGFNVEKATEAYAGQSTGVTFQTQIYIRPGEIMCKKGEQGPHVTTKFKANIFWMSKEPLIKGKDYKLKITTQQVPVELVNIISVLDASELSSIGNKSQVDRHDVAECILETLKPVAFDDINHIAETGRFVIVDNYEIAGGGIILSPVFEQESILSQYVKSRDFNWVRSDITPLKRALKYQHKSALIVIIGDPDTGKKEIAKALEASIFGLGKFTYFLGISNELSLTEASSNDRTLNKMQHIQQLGNMSHILTDAGLVFITSISDIDEYELGMLKSLNQPNKTIVVNVGENRFPIDQIDLVLSQKENTQTAVTKIIDVLRKAIALDPEYFI